MRRSHHLVPGRTGRDLSEPAELGGPPASVPSRSLSGRLLVSAAASRRRRKIARAVLRTAAPVLPRVPPPREPVFILGSPRSGTTLLFEILKRSSRLSSLPGESHLLGELFHPSERAGLRVAGGLAEAVGMVTGTIPLAPVWPNGVGD